MRRRRGLAAADGGARWGDGPEREGEGGEAHEHHKLTRSVKSLTSRLGADRSGGEELSGAAAVAEETGTVAAIAGIPASIPWPGMKRMARRIPWWRRRGTGWSEARASSTAAAADVGLKRGQF